MIVHIVCWKFKEEAQGATRQENILGFKLLLEELPAKISCIKDFQVGLNEMAHKGDGDISLYSTFDSFEALDEYANHPEHLKVVAFAKERVEKRMFSDYTF